MKAIMVAAARSYRFNRRRRIADLTDFLLRRAATRPTITYRQLVIGTIP